MCQDVLATYSSREPKNKEKRKKKERLFFLWLNTTAFICVRRQGEAICFNKVVLGLGSGNSCSPSHNGTPEAERACVSTLLLQNKKKITTTKKNKTKTHSRCLRSTRPEIALRGRIFIHFNDKAPYWLFWKSNIRSASPRESARRTAQFRCDPRDDKHS